MGISNYLGSSTSLLKQNSMSNGKIFPTVPAKMPKHIQMGTGFPSAGLPVAALSLNPLASQQSQTNLTQLTEEISSVSQPDLLSDHNRVGLHNSR